MNMSVFETAKQNITKAVGADSYEEVIRADEKKIKKFAENAKKKSKLKLHTKATVFSTGNPYVMLSRKVNSKGKRV